MPPRIPGGSLAGLKPTSVQQPGARVFARDISSPLAVDGNPNVRTSPVPGEQWDALDALLLLVVEVLRKVLSKGNRIPSIKKGR